MKYKMSNKCTLCGQCINYCDKNAIAYKSGHFIINDNCDQCGICFDLCPERAIIEKKDKEEIAEEAEINKKFEERKKYV